MNPMNYVYLAIILFSIGSVAVLLRRNAIVAFMGVELMLNAANLVLVAFAHMRDDGTGVTAAAGHSMAFFVLVVAAAEVVVGLAIIVALFRSRQTINLDEPAELKG